MIIFFIPFYCQLKLCFFIWLSHDNTKGAQKLYYKFIEKKLIQNEDKIDDTLDNLSKNIELFGDEITDFSKVISKEISKNIVDEIVEQATNEKTKLL